MTLENQALHLENERLRAENAFLRGQLDAVRQILIDRGLDEGPHAGLLPARVERAIAGIVGERDEARAEVERLRGTIRKSCDDHIALAAQYEAAGNTRGAMHLRATGNLLGAIYQGKTPTAIYPPATPGEGGWGMTDHEVALIVRDARSSGFVQAEDDFFPYIRSRGVTVEDYTRYERGRTVRWCVFCVVVAVAVSAWSIYVTWRAGR